MKSKISTQSMLSLFIIALAKDKATGYDMTKHLGVNWSHQQIYRDCNKLAQAGIIFPTIKNNEGKPDSKVYFWTDTTVVEVESYLLDDLIPVLKGGSPIPDLIPLAIRTLLNTECFSGATAMNVKHVLVDRLLSDIEEAKENLVAMRKSSPGCIAEGLTIRKMERLKELYRDAEKLRVCQ